MVFVHGFFPILILGFICPFITERGYVAINALIACIYEGMNNGVLDQFGWNLVVKVIIDGIMMG